ncbi:MAG: ribosome maturation factor RimP [Bacteroidia bacterium]|nr:ribosome maturation factor RimP [Bacteroidia bacterium]
MALIDTIKSIVETEVENTPYFLVDVVQGERSKKIQVLLDGDEGIPISQCSRISRAISKVVDEDDFEADPFILEVSSPGADMPLKNQRQYPKHIGRKLEIETHQGVQTIKLLEVREAGLLGEPQVGKKKKKEEVEPVEIPFSEIVKSTVVLSFK